MQKVFIIAEAGINHNGDVEEAKRLIDVAQKSGANAVKFQSYHTDSRVKKDNPAYEILKKCELSKEEQMSLISHGKDMGTEVFFTVFDSDHLSFLLNDCGAQRIKLASFDIVNMSFLREINQYARSDYNLNVLLSTGMSDLHEINNARNCLSNVSNLTLMYCVSAYPIKDESQINLSSIQTLKSFAYGPIKVGYSNHHKSSDIPLWAVLMGAKTIECHFMENENDKCVDAPVSLDKKMFSDMVNKIRRAETIMGDGVLGLKQIEKDALGFRRVSG